jgi:hypothetical protein
MKQQPTFTYQIWQDGMMVASATSTDKATAKREGLRYLHQYAQDGSATIRGPDVDMTVEHSR